MAGGRLSRVRRWFALLLVAVVCVAALGVAAFVQTAEGRLATLPAQVRAAVAAHHDQYLPLSAVPIGLQHAVIAVEDRSFYTNSGISLEGLARAAWVDLTTHSFAEGGSTITQELVRDQLLGNQKTLKRKLTEVAYALLAARRFSKAQVLDMFLNQAYFGHGAYGVQAAAKTYFALRPMDLDLAQEALLAGLLQAPADLDPLLYRNEALARQAVVLQAMVESGYISRAQAEAAAKAPLLLVPSSG